MYKAFDEPPPTGGRRHLLCVASVFVAFVLGLAVGVVLLPLVYFKTSEVSEASIASPTDGVVSSVVVDGIYWSETIESRLPRGYTDVENHAWGAYVRGAVGVRLEVGCGRMQNRLLTFEDGSQACVRYRQNTDQIQGELFSFYLARVLGIRNLAPSVLELVDVNETLWRNVRSDIATSQWKSSRPVVLTKFVPKLTQAKIPEILKPSERHLDKKTVDGAMVKSHHLTELAQWSDLIVFDYLTANLDRVVNNLYNYQWNSNIMDAPAHNLAKSLEDDLLVFLDNESGLLHGYRLLKKYEAYHSVLLDNLCVFRRKTVEVVRGLRDRGDVGVLLRGMFEEVNGARVRDVLPPLPEKSVKILNERLGRVCEQIDRCEQMFGGS